MFKNIIPSETFVKILDDKNTVVIDCRFYLDAPERGYREYLESHIPHAHYAHLDKDLSGKIIAGKTGRHPFPAISEFSQKCGEWGITREAQVVVYDQGGGGIAARLWFLLKWLGHEHVAVLNGGWAQWLKKGMPSTSEVPLPRQAIFIPQENPDMLVTADIVAEVVQHRQRQLVDARAAERYSGETEPIDPVAGHIPGAASVPFTGNLDNDGHFLPPERLKERFVKALEAHRPEDTIFYCGSGVTACHNLLAMDYAGLPGAKLYPGSWSEWITDTGRPVARGSSPG